MAPDDFRTFLETSSLESYHEFEVSKYMVFATCSTHGHYILRKYCILKLRGRSSFRGSKFPRNPGKKYKFVVRWRRASTGVRSGLHDLAGQNGARLGVHQLQAARFRGLWRTQRNFVGQIHFAIGAFFRCMFTGGVVRIIARPQRPWYHQ